MSLDIPEEHGLVFVVLKAKTPSLPVEFVTLDEFYAGLNQLVDSILAEHNADRFLRADLIVGELFNLMLSGGAIDQKITTLSHEYYKLDSGYYPSFRSTYLANSALHDEAKAIGPRFFPDAFRIIEDAVSQGRAVDFVEAGEEPNAPNTPERTSSVNPHALDNEERRTAFLRLVRSAQSDVEAADLPNTEKATALSYLESARILAENPDPPVDIIWEIVSRANNVLGIASFFLSLISFLIAVG